MKKDEVPIKEILSEMKNAREAFGWFGGMVVILRAIAAVSRARWPIRLGVLAALSAGGAKAGGWI